MGMTGLFTAVSGLQAAQASLYTTGHNMANHSVRGFTRQHVAQTTFFYRTIGRNNTGALQVGLGTNMEGIRQIRDKFLDMRWREAAPQLHFWDVQFSTGRELDSIFGELEGQFRMQGALRDFNMAMHELLKEPGSIESRSNFIHFAGSFLSRAEDAARSMRAYQDELNNQVISTVQRINQLLVEIDDLNRRIAREEIGGARANDFRDWRNNAIDELSTLIDINYRPDVRTGAYTIWTDGHMLLSGGHINTLGLRHSSPGSPFVEPVFTSSFDTLIYDPTGRNAVALFNWERISHEEYMPPRGQLFSLLVARGLSPVNYQSAPPPTVADLLAPPYYLEREVAAFTRNQVMQMLNTIDANGWTGYIDPLSLAAMQTHLTVALTNFINDTTILPPAPVPPALTLLPSPPGPTPPPQLVSMVNWINNELQPTTIEANTDIAAYRREARFRFDITHGVITRTQAQFDTMINSIVTMFNTALTTDILGLGLPGMPQDLHGNPGVPLFVQIRPGEPLTLGNLQINPELLGQHGASRLALQFDDSISGESEVRIVAWMIEQWSSPDLVQFNDWVSMGVDTFYRNFITEMAINTDTAGSAVRGNIEVMNSLDQRRLQISGVSLEEEMSNMIRFQHAYNASARMINTLDSMLDRIINHMGRGG